MQDNVLLTHQLKFCSWSSFLTVVFWVLTVSSQQLVAEVGCANNTPTQGVCLRCSLGFSPASTDGCTLVRFVSAIHACFCCSVMVRGSGLWCHICSWNSYSSRNNWGTPKNKVISCSYFTYTLSSRDGAWFYACHVVLSCKCDGFGMKMIKIANCRDSCWAELELNEHKVIYLFNKLFLKWDLSHLFHSSSLNII